MKIKKIVLLTISVIIILVLIFSYINSKNKLLFKILKESSKTNYTVDYVKFISNTNDYAIGIKTDIKFGTDLYWIVIKEVMNDSVQRFNIQYSEIDKPYITSERLGIRKYSLILYLPISKQKEIKELIDYNSATEMIIYDYDNKFKTNLTN